MSLSRLGLSASPPQSPHSLSSTPSLLPAISLTSLTHASSRLSLLHCILTGEDPKIHIPADIRLHCISAGDDPKIHISAEIHSRHTSSLLPACLIVLSPYQHPSLSLSLSLMGEASKLIVSSFYSGPTIKQIESALSSTVGSSIPRRLPPQSHQLAEKGVGKTDVKHVLTIKSSGRELAEDGYRWRKYGQKTIKNSPNPRSYYRCSNPRCQAKKQVERSKEDPEMLIITYEGLHLHYPSSHLFLRRSHRDYDDVDAAKRTTQMPKRLPELQYCVNIQSCKTQKQEEEEDEDEEEGKGNLQLVEGLRKDDVVHQQGLLEDIVPLLLREPNGASYSSSSSSGHPHHFLSQPSWASY
ncbi:hypothetical protein Cni_G05678 [Canna indica]|uniref:WRKY domain-containing protein n=1 Tax=Canna indica TaxID=4628 RepID=A0AAQ3Q591_9LILI|nr:hypothetical protein Cni_G05678 [Canna indica]